MNKSQIFDSFAMQSIVVDNIFSSSDLGLVIKSVNGPFLYANKKFYQMMKGFLKTKDVVGKPYDRIFLKEYLSQLNFEEDFNHKNAFGHELVFRGKDKVNFFFCITFKIKQVPPQLKISKSTQLIGMILLDSNTQKIQSRKKPIHEKADFGNNRVSKLVRQIKKITKFNESKKGHEKLREAIKQIENLSNRDFLTNLYNRHAFEEIIKLELKKASRYNFEISLLLIDIDNFKSINDNYGHIVGDDILKKLSKLLTRSVRETDYICRWGGEEFTVILPKCGLENAKLIADKVLKAVRQYPFKPMQVTISIGVVERDLNESITSWFIRADEALFRAKRKGKDRISV